MSAFMAQAGRLVVCGDAGDALGDSIYEAAHLRARHGRLPRRRLRREADARRAPAPSSPSCSPPPGSTDDPAEFTPLRLGPAALPLRTSTTDVLRSPGDDPPHCGTAPISTRCASPRPSTAPPSPTSSAPPPPASTTSAAGAPSARVPHFDDLLFLGASHVPLPAGGLPREVRHRRRPRRPARAAARCTWTSRSPSPG